MIKLVVSDFDGTLLPYGQSRVSAKVFELIKELHNKGIVFAVASGRTYSELTALMNGVIDDMYYICDDGAVTVKNGVPVFKKQFPAAALDSFFDDDLYKNVTMYSLDKAYLIGDNKTPVSYGKTPCRIKRRFEIKDDIYKIAANVKCFDLVDSKYYRVHYSDGGFAEFVSPYANKGVAVADLQLKLGVSKYDTVVIGDADNDIPMIAHSVNSWCIGERYGSFKNMCNRSAESAEEVLKYIIDNI